MYIIIVLSSGGVNRVYNISVCIYIYIYVCTVCIYGLYVCMEYMYACLNVCMVYFAGSLILDLIFYGF